MAETKSPRGKGAISQVIGFLVGAVLTLAFLELLPTTSPLALGAILVFFITGVAVHEFGHFCAASLLDFRVLSVSVGPLQVANENGKVHFRRNRGMRLGGFVAVAPKGSEDLRRRMMLTVLAGPLISFGAAAAAIAVGVLLGNSGGWVLSWGVMSAFMGVISSLPAQKFYVSDGARIRMLFRETPEAERCCAQLLIVAAAISGVRPRDWDRALLGMMLAVRDGSGDTVTANVMAYEAAMDRGTFEDAGTHLSAALALRENCPPALRAGLALDAAFFQSVIQGDAVAARQWCRECNPKLIIDRYSVLLVEAAVLLAEQKPAEARERASACLAALPQARFPGFAKASEDWARLLMSRAEAQLAATTSE